MSDIALRRRSARQLWAAPGSRHDRVIGITYWLLPVLIGVLAAFLIMAPLTMGGDSSFVLDKNRVEVAKERLRIQAARYRGSDDKGQPFQLTAGSAVQRTSSDPVVQMNRLAAGIRLDDGPATLTAPQGRYDMDAQQVRVDGPIAFRGADGYSLDTSDALVDLKSRQLRSTSAVTGTVRQGRFSGNSMRADLNARTVTLEGNARLRIQPRGAR